MPRLSLNALLAAVLALGLGLPAAGAADQDGPPDPTSTRERLQQLEGQLESEQAARRRRAAQTAKLQQEFAALRRKLIAAAAETQRTEAAMTAGEARLRELAGRIYAAQATLDARSDDVAGTLTALARLQRHPPALLLVHGRTALDAARSARLLSLSATALNADAQLLRGELDALTTLKRDVESEQHELAALSQQLRQSQTTLDRLLKDSRRRRQLLQSQDREAARRLTVLSGQAKDVRGLLRRLEEAEAETRRRQALAAPAPGVKPRAPDATRPLSFAMARGRLAMPAQGRLVRRFGEGADSGVQERGITLMTRDNAEVVAPFDGRVAFAGPFRHYGLVLIIAHGEGYHTLLAGLSRVYVETGHHVLASEPVGQMGRGDGKSRSLYVELRRKGEAIDPHSWWMATGRKVSG